jgi:hypothetical protein
VARRTKQERHQAARREAFDDFMTALLGLLPLAMLTLRHLATAAENPAIRKGAAESIVEYSLKAHESHVLAQELAELRRLVDSEKQQPPDSEGVVGAGG